MWSQGSCRNAGVFPDNQGNPCDLPFFSVCVCNSVGTYTRTAFLLYVLMCLSFWGWILLDSVYPSFAVRPTTRTCIMLVGVLLFPPPSKPPHVSRLVELSDVFCEGEVDSFHGENSSQMHFNVSSLGENIRGMRCVCVREKETRDIRSESSPPPPNVSFTPTDRGSREVC